MREWRRMYNNVHRLGKILKNSRPDYDGNPALHALSISSQLNVEAEIKDCLNKTSNYLDGCGLTLSKTRWNYEPKDPTTWISHDSFEFDHLVKY
jgi:hypothetical protein